MNALLSERLQAAERIATDARSLAAGNRVDEAEQLLNSSRASFDELYRELSSLAAAAGPRPEATLLAKARSVLPQVSLQALFAGFDPGANMRPFFAQHAAHTLTPEIAGLFRQEIERQSAEAQCCTDDTNACRDHIEKLEARVAILSRFVFLFRVQCLAEAVRPTDYARTAAAITAELRELGPLPGGEGVRAERWREHERLFLALLGQLPPPPDAGQTPTPLSSTHQRGTEL